MEEIKYNYKVWTPGMPVVQGMIVAVDTETELIIEHHVPPLVLMSVSDGTETHVVLGRDHSMAYLDRMHDENCRTYVMHNVAFDYWVLEGHPLLKDAVSTGGMYDTMLMLSMWHAASQGYVGQRSLKAACKEILGVEIEKDDAVRLSFKVGQSFTEDQLSYAAGDSIWTWRLYQELKHKLDKVKRRADGWLLSNLTHVAGAVALPVLTRNGMLVDDARRRSIKEKFEKEILEIRRGVFTSAGIWTPGGDNIIGPDGMVTDEALMSGSKDIKALEKILILYEKRLGKSFQRTEKSGKISLTEESVEEFIGSNIPLLEAYGRHDHAVKMISTYLNDELIKEDGRTHSRFNSFLNTSRTSSSNPNSQNLPRGDGIRGIFVPPEGYLLCAADFGQLEIVTLAQHCVWMYGKSRMADLINEGIDVHGWFASLLTKKLTDKTPLAEAKKIIKEYKAGDPVTYKHNRQLAKAGNFGRSLNGMPKQNRGKNRGTLLRESIRPEGRGRPRPGATTTGTTERERRDEPTRGRDY